MKVLSLPVEVDDEPLASFALSPAELEKLLGEGMELEILPFTMPGPLLGWPRLLASGTKILFVFDENLGDVTLFAEPKDVDAVIEELGIRPESCTWRWDVVTPGSSKPP